MEPSGSTHQTMGTGGGGGVRHIEYYGKSHNDTLYVCCLDSSEREIIVIVRVQSPEISDTSIIIELVSLILGQL